MKSAQKVDVINLLSTRYFILPLMVRVSKAQKNRQDEQAVSPGLYKS